MHLWPLKDSFFLYSSSVFIGQYLRTDVTTVLQKVIASTTQFTAVVLSNIFRTSTLYSTYVSGSVHQLHNLRSCHFFTHAFKPTLTMLVYIRAKSYSSRTNTLTSTRRYIALNAYQTLILSPIHRQTWCLAHLFSSLLLRMANLKFQQCSDSLDNPSIFQRNIISLFCKDNHRA